jgi:HlyD family secretion protein
MRYHPSSALPFRHRQAGLSRWWLLPVVMAAAVIWVMNRPPYAPTATVSRQPLVHTIVASGRVETRFRTTIASAQAGTVREVLVDDGAAVTAGQALLRLDERELRAALRQAEAAVEVARARLKKLLEVSLPLARESVSQTKIALDQARRIRDHDATLGASGSIGAEQRAQSAETASLRDSQWKAAQQQWRALEAGGAERRLAEAELTQALASRDLAAARLSLLTVIAPADGQILRRDVEPGQVVQTTTPLFLFVPKAPLRIVAQIDEKNMADIQPGQTALVKPDAFPARTLDGRVSRIAPSVDANRGAVEIDVEVDDRERLLRDDMTVSVEIRIADKPDALTLDALAVRARESGKPWVWRVEDGSVFRRDISIGARGNGAVEITAGLQEGDVAVAAPTLSLSDGQRIRAGARQSP